RSYFVYGEDVPLKSVVVAEQGPSRRLLQLAAAPLPGQNQSCEVVSPSEAGVLKLGETALVLWQAPLPASVIATDLQRFTNDGGVVVFFPPGQADSGSFSETKWGAVESAAAEKPFKLRSWQNQEGPLAQTQNGADLPLSELTFLQRQPPISDATV